MGSSNQKPTLPAYTMPIPIEECVIAVMLIGKHQHYVIIPICLYRALRIACQDDRTSEEMTWLDTEWKNTRKLHKVFANFGSFYIRLANHKELRSKIVPRYYKEVFDGVLLSEKFINTVNSLLTGSQFSLAPNDSSN